MGSIRKHQRELRRLITVLLEHHAWDKLPAAFTAVGLPWRDELAEGRGKLKNLGAVLGKTSDADALGVGGKCVEPDVTSGWSTASIQDEIWWIESGGHQTITEVTRRSLLQAFERRRFTGALSIDDFRARILGPTWPLLTLLAGVYEYASDGSLLMRGGVSSLMVQKPTQAVPVATAVLLDQWGFLTWPDQRVRLFLEALVDPRARQGQEQAKWVELINGCVRADDLTLMEGERISGHPTFTLSRTDKGVKGRPKNIIFASSGPKPTLGLIDAVNNDVVVLDNEKHCLVFDEPISEDGLLWDTLVEWWARTQMIDDEAAARKALGERLLASVAADSPPEQVLFKSYCQTMRSRLKSRLPALRPQVYLLYDPKTIRERAGRKKFPVQRMDFVLLLANRVRIVIEVDGRQHHSTNGKRLVRSLSAQAMTRRSPPRPLDAPDSLGALRRKHERWRYGRAAARLSSPEAALFAITMPLDIGFAQAGAASALPWPTPAVP